MVETLNLADVLRVFCVDKLKAELEVEQAKLAVLREERDRRATKRERQREAGKRRTANARRGPDGRLLPSGRDAPCPICDGKRNWGLAELEEHRRHKSERNGSANHAEKPNVLQ